jgi:hypothetical protein
MLAAGERGAKREGERESAAGLLTIDQAQEVGLGG